VRCAYRFVAQVQIERYIPRAAEAVQDFDRLLPTKTPDAQERGAIRASIDVEDAVDVRRAKPLRLYGEASIVKTLGQHLHAGDRLL